MSQKYWSGNGPHQSTQDSSPSYTYRDQTLFHPADGTNYVAASKRRQFLLLRFLVKVFFLLFAIGSAMILPLHYLAVYSTYRQGTCTITDKQVIEHDSKDKHGNITSRTYYPSFSYLVHPLSGEQTSATGYDGPSQAKYDNSSDAQAVVDRYQIGETTSCSYNPAEPYKAFLVFYGYGTIDAMGTFFLGLLLLSGLAIAVYLMLDWMIWRLYALRKRGVVTEGTVLRNEERRSRHRRYIVSIIAFRALEEPTREQQITISCELDVGSYFPVCYDPFYPRYRCHGGWPSSRSYVLGLLGIAGLLIIAFFIMLGLWVVP
ncbi:MAG TPA: DUF3592 domain-containing protein [Ktedonobacteraceae bacterium]|nr:DUF3592 domain-containing protein [Ktedonobacteraceae bacterium]